MIRKLSFQAQKSLIQRVSCLFEAYSEVFLFDEEKDSWKTFIDESINLNVKKIKKKENQLGVILYLIRGKYSSSFEWDTWKAEWSLLDFDLLDRWNGFFNAKKNFLIQEIENSKNICFASCRVWVDVTQAGVTEKISGIPRVSINILKEWKKQKVSFKTFQVLDDKTAQIFDSNKNKLLKNVFLLSQIKTLKNIQLIVRSVYVLIFDFLINFLKRSKSKKLKAISDKIIFTKDKILFLKKNKNKKIPHKIISPFLLQTSWVLLEVVFEKKRIHFYEAALNQTGVNWKFLVHDLIPLYYPEFCPDEKEFRSFANLLHFVKYIICVSSYVSNQVSHFLDSKKKNQDFILRDLFLANTFDLNLIREKISTGKTLKFLSVGTIEKRKNQVMILRAAMHLWRAGKEFELYFVGSRGFLCEDFLYLLRLCRQEKRPVFWFSEASDEVLVSLYQECDATLFMSFEEGFGLPVIESLAFGKPCLLSDREPLNKLAIEGGCLLINPYQFKELVDRWKYLLEDLDAMNHLSQEAKLRKFPIWSDQSKRLAVLMDLL